MKISIKDTVNTLCSTCKYAHIRKSRNNDVVIKCWRFDERIKREVVDCTDYDHKNTPYIQDMVQIAWVINLDKPGKIGFVHYKDLSEAEKRDLEFL